MTDDTEPRTYDAETIERFVTALVAVAAHEFGASEVETYARLVTIRTTVEDLSKQLASDRPGDQEINWVQYQTGMLKSRAADIAERYGSTEARA